MRLFNGFLFLLVVVLLPSNLALGNFHFMQIEQVIAGVNGDTSAQAIQLRMRFASQGVLNSSKIEAADAAGVNPVILERPTNVVNDAAGARILFATPNFANYTDIPLDADFIMDPIPLSYLAAGRLKFMADSVTPGIGVIYWSLSWGGAAYTGSNTGNTANDANGNFGPAVGIALPTTGVQALQFTGTAGALSTSNNAQYALTAGAAVFINNDNVSFTVTVPAPPGTPGDFNDDGVVDAADYVVWKKTEGTDFDLGGNGDETGGSANVVDTADYNLWVASFGETSAGSGGAVHVPEPVSCLSLLAFAQLGMRRRRRVE